MNHYRITFYPSAADRIDPFEFAWLLAKYDLNVTAKNEWPALFVSAERPECVENFAYEVNRQFGALIFKAIELETKDGLVEIDSISN